MIDNIEVVDAFPDNTERPRTIYTVRIGKCKYIDVMRYVDDWGAQSAYIMQCADGNEIYDYDGSTYPGHAHNEKEILEKVSRLPVSVFPEN